MYPKLESIIRGSMDLWEGYLTHPFITGLADGTLSDERFLHYLIQDTLYLREYARVFAMAMYRSSTMEEIRAYYSILSFVQSDESTFRLRCLQEAGLDSAAVDRMDFCPENRAYCDFMLEMAEQHGVIEILMAILPCMFSYAWLFARLTERYPAICESRYWPFIEGYTSEAYADDCRSWADFTEQRLQQADAQELARLGDLFRRSSQYEAGFWDMSYRA